MAHKKENDYFEWFRQGVAYSCEAATQLHAVFAQYEPARLPAHIDAMHTVEHAADLEKHAMMECLVKEFLPPIDREDIMELAGAIDDVTDAIEDVLLRLYMYDVKAPREDAAEFAGIVLSCCTALADVMAEFENFRKSKTIHEKLVEVNRLEEEGDKLYTKAVRALYTGAEPPVRVLAWTELFDRLEKCCDACEHVADAVERVILKNS